MKPAPACGLGYPGGPAIQRAAEGGNPERIRFPRTEFQEGNLDFSFSGLKTAALNFLNRLQQEAKQKDVCASSLLPIADFAASFQNAVVSVANIRLKQLNVWVIKTIALAGGVAANLALRQLLTS